VTFVIIRLRKWGGVTAALTRQLARERVGRRTTILTSGRALLTMRTKPRGTSADGRDLSPLPQRGHFRPFPGAAEAISWHLIRIGFRRNRLRKT